MRSYATCTCRKASGSLALVLIVIACVVPTLLVVDVSLDVSLLVNTAGWVSSASTTPYLSKATSSLSHACPLRKPTTQLYNRCAGVWCELLDGPRY